MPSFKYRDINDEHDVSVVLQKVLCDPPLHVIYLRLKWDKEYQLEMVVNSLPLEEGQLNTTVSECTGWKRLKVTTHIG